MLSRDAIRILNGDFAGVVLRDGESQSDAFATAFNMAIEALKGKSERERNDDYGYTDLDRYQQLAARTINRSLNEYQMEMHGVFGLCAEAGEVAGLYQKSYQGHEITEEHLKKELGDCLWMIAEICTANDWDMSDIAELNIQKLKARYPEGFDAEKSLHRADGDI